MEAQANEVNNTVPAQVLNPKKSKLKKFFNFLLLVIVVAAGLYFIFSLSKEFNNAGENKPFAQAFSEMNIWLFVLAAGLLGFYILTDGLKILIISKTATGRGKLVTGLKAAILCKFYDNITPSSTGGQPMQIAYLIKKGYKVGDATAISITRFFVQMFAWSLVGLVLMIVGYPSLEYISDIALRSTLQVFAWVGFALILSLPLMTIASVIFPKVTKRILFFFIRVGKKMHIVKNEEKIIAKTDKTVSDFVSSVKLMCTKPFNFFVLIVLCLLEPIITFSLPYILLLAFNNEAFTFQNYFTVCSLYMYAHNSAACIFTPGNSGAFEVTLTVALSGVSKNVSIWVIFFFRFLTYYVNVIIGIILLTFEFFRSIYRSNKRKKLIKEMILNRKPLPEPLEKKSVAVLLSTYNGEKYVKELLDSLHSQYGINLTIVVRDDGSKDNTPKILQEYKDKGIIDILILGENVGFQKSFHKLLEAAPKCDYYAFSDQDDIWDADKVLTGVDALKDEDHSLPLLYWCSFRSMDKNGKIYKLYSSRTQFSEGVDPLIKNINTNDIRGCTCVFNQVSLDMMLSMGLDGYRYHDWMIQIIASMFGKEIYDMYPHISYRCHENNCFGPAKANIDALKRVIKFYKTVELNNNHSKTAKEFYNAFKDRITDPKQLEFLESVVNYQTDKEAKKKLLHNKEMFRSMPFFLAMLIKYEIRHNKY